MGVRTHEAAGPPLRVVRPGPGAWRVAAVFFVTLALLLCNGRPVAAPDSSGAAGWLWKAALQIAASFVEVDATAAALVGKLLAAAFAALAAGALFAAVARRHIAEHARWAALVLATGTTLAAAAQSWSGEAPATCAVAVALWLLARGDVEDDGATAARAGLPLALAAALEPATIPLALALGVAVVARWRDAGPPLLSWAAAGGLVGFVGIAAARETTTPVTIAASGWSGAAALLVSPAKGAVVFAPVALVGIAGLVRAWRSAGRRRWDEETSRLLPVACGAGFVLHIVSVAVLGGWDAGLSWGPRLLAPAWPLVLVFLPEGLAATRISGVLLVSLSIAVQALGAFAYDGRWDRLHRDASGGLGAATWDVARSPIAFQWRERVVRPSLVALDGRRLTVREHALVRDSASGSFVSFGSGRLRATGSDATMESLRLEQGAVPQGDCLRLRQRGDGIAFRVRPGARPRRLELRVAGHGQGTLGFGDAGVWNAARWRERAVSGAFRLRLPYSFAETRAAELSVVLRSGGPLVIDSVALVPPGDPDDVIRLP